MKKYLYIFYVFTCFFCFSIQNLIGAEKVMKVLRGDEDYPPFEMVVDGKLTGFHIDLITTVATQIGYKVEFVSYPWKRALSLMEESKADALSFVSINTEREKHMIFLTGNLISRAHFVLVVKESLKDKIYYDGTLVSIKDRSIAVHLGFYYGYKFEKANFANKHPYKSSLQISRALELGRVDLAAMNYYEYLGELKKGSFKETVPLSPSFGFTNVYIAFAKNKGALAQRFAEALTDFKKSEEYKKMLEKYNIIIDD